MFTGIPSIYELKNENVSMRGKADTLLGLCQLRYRGEE